MSASTDEIRFRSLHEFQVGNDPSEPYHDNAATLGNQYPNSKTCYNGSQKYLDGDTSVRNTLGAGRFSVEDSEALHEAVQLNSDFKSRKLSSEFHC